MEYIAEILMRFGETFVAPLQNMFRYLPLDLKRLLIAIFSAGLVALLGKMLSRLDK